MDSSDVKGSVLTELRQNWFSSLNRIAAGACRIFKFVTLSLNIAKKVIRNHTYAFRNMEDWKAIVGSYARRLSSSSNHRGRLKAWTKALERDDRYLFQQSS